MSSVEPHLHHESHFTASESVRDVVIGLADGLTVPFALAAGLAGAVSAGRLVVIAGLAEIAAGSIAMGLGGYLASRGDTEHFASERLREEREIVERPADEEAEIYEIFEQYGVAARQRATPVLRSLQANPTAWVDFMMRFELGLEEPARGRARRSALTIAVSYIAGGIHPARIPTCSSHEQRRRTAHLGRHHPLALLSSARSRDGCSAPRCCAARSRQ